MNCIKSPSSSSTVLSFFSPLFVLFLCVFSTLAQLSILTNVGVRKLLPPAAASDAPYPPTLIKAARRHARLVLIFLFFSSFYIKIDFLFFFCYTIYLHFLYVWLSSLRTMTLACPALFVVLLSKNIEEGNKVMLVSIRHTAGMPSNFFFSFPSCWRRTDWPACPLR